MKKEWIEQQTNVERQFAEYLRIAKLNPADMMPGQYQETKRAFFGAWGQCLLAMRDVVGEIDDEKLATDILGGMINQVYEFWIGENKQKT